MIKVKSCHKEKHIRVLRLSLWPHATNQLPLSVSRPMCPPADTLQSQMAPAIICGHICKRRTEKQFNLINVILSFVSDFITEGKQGGSLLVPELAMRDTKTIGLFDRDVRNKQKTLGGHRVATVHCILNRKNI